MARNYKPKRFADMGLLKKLNFPLLLRLFEPYRLFFEGHPDFVWSTSPDEVRFDLLAETMLHLDRAIPTGLLESLYYIETLSDNNYFDELLAAAQRRNIVFGDTDPTIEDLALLLRLECPEVVEQLHADIYRTDSKQRAKRFESYFPQNGAIKPMTNPDKETLTQMQSELDDWSRNNRRGIGMRIFVTHSDLATWFMIRHGQPMKRENTVEPDGEDGLVFYRPEKFDILIYYPANGELAIGVCTKAARIVYSRIIGKYLFDDPYYFNVEGCTRYTLAPLLENGPAALACWDIPEIRLMLLREIHIHYPDRRVSTEVLKGENIMIALTEEKRGEMRKNGGIPMRAKFKTYYADGRERIVEVEPPNAAHYDHETDHETVHAWLLERGFIVNDSNDNNVIQGVFHERSEEVLAVA